MTKEEALKILDTIPTISEQVDALEMAIKALEQQPCEDCISREAVLEQIDDWRKNEFLRVTNPLHYLRKRIGSLPSVAPQPKAEQKWISVSERLPESGESVLVWYEYYKYGDYNGMYETYGIGFYWAGQWGGDVSGRNARCIAWMPLPEPYKAESEDVR